jgi:hypothetical protein
MQFTAKKAPFMQMKIPLVGNHYSVMALSCSFEPEIKKP